jgi:FAD:protein FMN transferase
VTVELAQPGGMAKRPYVAIWIEDADRRPVPTIALLFQNSRYLSELRVWYRGDRHRATLEGTEIVDSVASATRSQDWS